MSIVMTIKFKDSSEIDPIRFDHIAEYLKYRGFEMKEEGVYYGNPEVSHEYAILSVQSLAENIRGFRDIVESIRLLKVGKITELIQSENFGGII